MILGLFIIRGYFLIVCFLLKTAGFLLQVISPADREFSSSSPQTATCSLQDISSSLQKLTLCFTHACHFWRPNVIRSSLFTSYTLKDESLKLYLTKLDVKFFLKVTTRKKNITKGRF